VFNITADSIHVYNLTIRCKTLTHDAKHAINGELESNILSKSFAKTCSLNCVHNFDHPIKKNRVEYSVFRSSTTKKKNQLRVHIQQKMKCC